MLTPIVFFLVVTTCTEDRCKNVKVASYPTAGDCNIVAAKVRNADDTLWVICQPSIAKHDRGAP